MPVFLFIIAVLILAVFLFMRQSSFGALPAGTRLERIRRSPHFRTGRFHNLRPTPQFTDGATYTSVLREFLFGRNPRRQPDHPLPTAKSDLRALPPDSNVLVWFGHSSYFLQVDGKKILVDPVFSGAASPIRSTNPAFPGTDVYTADELPDIDFLFLTHDHWDHLDYPTLLRLWPRVGQVITGLGTGAHLERWGFAPERIREADWYDHLELGAGFTVDALPARHFSGRSFRRDQVLWMSFALRTPSLHLYLGGDSGYDTHFAEIGQQYGPFDLALLECGQYNRSWKHIHMMPEEDVQAAQDLRAKRLAPVHWGKFALANHDWDEPLKRVRKAAAQAGMPLVLPLIGEVVDLKDDAPFISKWNVVG